MKTYKKKRIIACRRIVDNDFIKRLKKDILNMHPSEISKLYDVSEYTIYRALRAICLKKDYYEVK